MLPFAKLSQSSILFGRLKRCNILPVIICIFFFQAIENARADFILINEDAPILQAMIADAKSASSGAPVFNYANLFRDGPGPAPLLQPYVPTTFTYNGYGGSTTGPSPGFSWDNFNSPINSSLLTPPPPPPPINYTPGDYAKISAGPTAEEAAAAGAVFAAIEAKQNLFKQKSNELFQAIDRDARSTFSEEHLVNKQAAQKVIDSLNEISNEAKLSKVPAAPVRIPRFEPLSEAALKQVAEERTNRIYDSFLQALHQSGESDESINFWGFPSREGSLERAKKIAVANARGADEVFYESLASSIEHESESAINELSNLSSHSIGRWQDTPAPAAGSKNSINALTGSAREAALTNYQFQSAGSFRDELVVIHSELVRTNPTTDRARHAKSIGIEAAVAADQAAVDGATDDAKFYKDVALGMLDITLSLTPGVGFAKDVHEAVTGYGLVTGEKLTDFERGMAIIGIATAGLGSKLVTTSKAFEKVASIIRPLARAAIDKGALHVAGAVAESSLGKSLAKARAVGFHLESGVYQILDRRVPLNNPFPKDRVFVKAIEHQYADKLKSGVGRMAPLGKTESFIGAAEDFKGVEKSMLAKKASLYTDPAGTVLKDTSDYVLVEFKFKNALDPNVYSPVDFNGARKFGWLPGGKTAGGAREWIVDPDAFKNGMVDLSSVVIREIK